jgi:hypothetical protein
MNRSIVKMPAVMRGAALAATAAGTLLGTSCNLFPPPEPGPGAPAFAPDGRHRYGMNGTQSPNYQENRPANQGQKEIKRDPNNDNINLEPPPPKNNNNKPDEPATAEKPAPANPPPHETTPPVEKPAVAPQEDLPFGTPVVGRPGFVYSPYAEEKGPVDVVGIKRGKKVKCPYTGKVFRVP